MVIIERAYSAPPHTVFGYPPHHETSRFLLAQPPTERHRGMIMTFQRNLMWTSVAFAAALTIGVPSMAGAQAPQAQGAGPAGAQAPGGGGRAGGRGRGAPPFTPAAGAKDLKSVMFNWGWYMGMLRSGEEYDLLMSLDYQGKGTMQVGGQPCTVTMYRSDISYQTSGERIRVTGTRPNGQSCSTIEVLSGA